MNDCSSGSWSAEHLAGEEVDDVRAGAVERRHARVPVGCAGQRERREVDARRPALGARDEQLDVGGSELEPSRSLRNSSASAP
jgi:hypothetical protein